MTVSDHRDLVTALLGVDGVAEAAVERGGDDDLGSLRLLLQPGADEVAVAGAVNDLLRARFGLAVDTPEVGALFVRSLYLPGGPPTRVEAGTRVARRWAGHDLGIPLRRIVATRCG